MSTDRRAPHVPLWLRALGACVLAVMAGSLVYAVAVPLANLSRIGV